MGVVVLAAIDIRAALAGNCHGTRALSCRQNPLGRASVPEHGFQIALSARMPQSTIRFQLTLGRALSCLLNTYEPPQSFRGAGGQKVTGWAGHRYAESPQLSLQLQGMLKD